MLPIPSLDELRQPLQQKRTPVIGILFAPPYTKVGSERIVPRPGYLNARTAEYIHFFCAGYGGYHFADDARDIGEVSYEDGTVIPWGFSERKFAEFVNDMEASTSWKYSGEADLILVEPDLEFTDVIVFDIEAMVKMGLLITLRACSRPSSRSLGSKDTRHPPVRSAIGKEHAFLVMQR
jgi:hypothetical protein